MNQTSVPAPRAPKTRPAANNPHPPAKPASPEQTDPAQRRPQGNEPVRSVQLRNRQDVGVFGELLAARALEMGGYVILERNWRGKGDLRGELDIIAQHGDTVCFVEVKTRATALLSSPAEAVTEKKLAALSRLAGAWLSNRDSYTPFVRIDVITVRVDLEPDTRILRGAVVSHLEDVTSWR